MNQRKAKRLRQAARQLAEMQNLPEKDYEHKTYRKVTTDLAGKYLPYIVYTSYLKDSYRKIYKLVKKESKKHYGI